MPAVYEAFGSVPSHIAPSVRVRRWDQGLLAGLVAFLVVFGVALLIATALPGSVGGYWFHFQGVLTVLAHYAGGTHVLGEPAGAYLQGLDMAQRMRVGLAALAGVIAAVVLGGHVLTPRSNTWHLSGPQLLDGKRARKKALEISRQAKDDEMAMALHLDLVLTKKQLSRHMWITGSVGSGKTVVLMNLVEQMCRANHKALIYDSKGDITAKGDFGSGNRPIIVSPFDRRSFYWDIGQDLRTPSQIANFAASIIPEDQGNGRFWSIAAQQLLTGAGRTLQDKHGTDWGWVELAKQLARAAPDMLPDLMKHYPKAGPLIANAESQSTASVLATLAGYTRVIDDMALAWPKRGKHMFSVTQWARDDYQGRGRQVLMQGGPDAQLTRAYVSALVNIAVPSIISASLPDNEEGRFIGIVLDELPSLGRINLPPLIDRGRSKGVVAICGMQDGAQLKEVYGENMAKSLMSMVGTKVVCQVNAGETRNEIAHDFGKKKVAWRNHGVDAAVHEESRAVVSPNKLTTQLGFRRGSKFGREKWGIRAIVDVGSDPMLLDFPGKTRPDVRQGQVPAKWLLGPAKPASKGEPDPVPPTPKSTRQLLALSMEQAKERIANIYSQR